MKISRIKIENFRSISSAEFSCNDFNVFVGQNNHGKTNLFEAIDWFYNKTPKGKSIDDLKFARKPENEILVEVEFIGAQTGADKMKNEKNKVSIKKVLDGADSIIISRNGKDEKFKITINGTLLEKPPTGFDSALKDFLPNFEYIHTKLYYDSLAKFGKTDRKSVV